MKELPPKTATLINPLLIPMEFVENNAIMDKNFLSFITPNSPSIPISQMSLTCLKPMRI